MKKLVGIMIVLMCSCCFPMACGPDLEAASVDDIDNLEQGLNAYEGETIYYANEDFTVEVGSYVKLCNGASYREGTLDGYARTVYRQACNTSQSITDCKIKMCHLYDGHLYCSWMPVACPGWFN